MKIPKEFEERLKRLETTLPFELDVFIYLSRYDEDEINYEISRGPYKGRHHLFREEGESQEAFQARAEAEAAERSPKSELIIQTLEEYLENKKKSRVIYSNSPADIRWREQERKRRREKIQQMAAANNPSKQNP